MTAEQLSTPEEIKVVLDEMSADANAEAVNDGYVMFTNGSTHTAYAYRQSNQFIISYKPNDLPSRTFAAVEALKVAMLEIAHPDAWYVRSDE